MTANGPIMVAIDTGKESRDALNWYIQNLYKNGQELVLLYVAQPTTKSHVPNPSEFDDMMKQADKMIAKVEGEFKTRLTDLGVTGRFRSVHHVKPGEAIVAAAQEEGAEAIVMGTRGLGKLRRTIMGSVSDYVLHHVNCPVLIYRPDKGH